MHTTARVRRSGVALPLALCGASLGAPSATGAVEPDAVETGAVPDDHTWTKHSSDGEPGRIAPRLRSGRFFADQDVTSSQAFTAADGVTFRR